MEIKELKELIESNKPIDNLIILKYSDNDFIIHQYLYQYRLNNNYDIQYVDNLTDLLAISTSNIFNDHSDCLNIFVTDNFTIKDERIKNLSNTVIITKKINKEYRILFENNIVEIPKLEAWQITDYINSLCPGLSDTSVSELIKICNNNIFRIDSEVRKISLFEEADQENLMQNFKRNDIFSDLSDKTIFDLSNALITRNKIKVSEVFKDIKNIDCEPFQLLTLLLNNFRNIINIQLGKSSTPESVGISPKQYWAIKKYSVGYYEADKLIKIFRELSDIDRKVKMGNFDVKYMIDYICLKIMQIADN